MFSSINEYFNLLYFSESEKWLVANDWSTEGRCEDKGCSYFGFSRGSGSLRPSPTGLFSASSPVSSWSSASTFPFRDKRGYVQTIEAEQSMLQVHIDSLDCQSRHHAEIKI